MSGGALGNESVPVHGEAGVFEPRHGGGGIRVVPEHGRAQVVVDSGPAFVSDDGEERATWLQPASQARDERSLIRDRDVDQRVQTDDGIELVGSGIPRGHVTDDELRRRHEGAGACDLHVGHVETGHREPGIGEQAGGGNPISAAEVEHTRSRRERGTELLDPGPVVVRGVVVVSVAERDRVVSPTDEIPLPRTHLVGRSHLRGQNLTGTEVGPRSYMPVMRGAGASGSSRRCGKRSSSAPMAVTISARDVGAQADVGAGAEAQVRLERACRIELVGTLPPRRVAVRCAQAHVHDGTLRYLDAGELAVARDEATEHRVGRHPAQRLLHHGAELTAIVADGCEPVGMAEQREHRDAHLLPRGARAGGEEDEGEDQHLLVGETMGAAVLFGDLGRDEHADEVVARLLAPGSHDRRHDARERFDTETVGRDRLPDVERVRHRHAEAPGDGEQRDRGEELDVEIGGTVGLHAVEQGVDRAHHPAFGPPRRTLGQERRLHERAVAPVLAAVHVEDAGVGQAGCVLGRWLRHERLAVAEHRVAGDPVERRPVRPVRVREALEEAVAREAHERSDDALVDRSALAQTVERRVRIGRESASARGIDGAGEIEEAPEPVAVEGVVVAHRFSVARAPRPGSRGRCWPGSRRTRARARA